MTGVDAQRRVLELLAGANAIAKEYRELTGRPLGITREVAEYDTAQLLGVTLIVARQARCVRTGSTPGERLGRIDGQKPFDNVLMVLLADDFDTISIHEADREDVIAALTAPGSKARNERRLGGHVPVDRTVSLGAA